MKNRKKMIELHKESLYLQGARDILLRLVDDFDMYLIPSVKCKCKPSQFLPEGTDLYDWFPLNSTTTRKLVGKGLLNALISDRESLNRFLQGDYKELEIIKVEKDKKGKIKNLKIQVI